MGVKQEIVRCFRNKATDAFSAAQQQCQSTKGEYVSDTNNNNNNSSGGGSNSSHSSSHSYPIHRSSSCNNWS